MLNLFNSLNNSSTNLLELIILLLGILSLLIIIFYYFYFFLRLVLYKKERTDFKQPISIIICAKNELKNLKKNLPLILEQFYFNFEVIIVNDQSTDTTKDFLDELAKKYRNLVIVDIDEFVTHTIGKKFALTLGIKTAKHEHLLLTDADCKPNSKNWLKKMVSNFNHSEILLGYGSYKRTTGLLNKIIRFDTFNVAQQYLSFALSGITYMGVGRNLGYKKSHFFKNKGFAKHIHIPSGDDDLFIQEIATKYTIDIEISEEAHTISEAPKTWSSWLYQKRRHLSTAPLYKIKFKILLALYSCSILSFWTSIFLLLFLGTDLLYAVILLTTKLVFSYLINYRIMRKLDVNDLYWMHPLYEFINLLLQGNFVLLNLFRKPNKWSR